MATASVPFAKLKPGPGRSPDEVEASQRARLQTALVEQVAETGYASLTVRGLARTAGVSTRTLYRRFGTLEDCFGSTYELAMSRALRRAETAGRRDRGEQALRAGMRELTRAIAERPEEAQLALVDAYVSGPATRARIDLTTAAFGDLLAAALAEVPGWTTVPPRLAQGMTAGIAHVARSRLLPSGESDRVRPARRPEPLHHQRVADHLASWVLSLGRACPQTPPGRTGGRPDDEPRSRSWGLPRGKAGDERQRIITTVARLAARDGYDALTVPRIRSDAGVSRRAFDAHFTGVEDCFLTAIETLVFSGLVAVNRLQPRNWEPGVRRFTLVLCGALARNRALGRLVFAEILAPGLGGLRCREHLIALVAERLCVAAPPERRPSGIEEEASVAAVWEIVQSRLSASSGGDLPRLAPMLAQVLTRPSDDRGEMQAHGLT
ncbi:MAG TPA: TetR/AcrR family transcriptional regulator [Solirubrobacterales bacterium]